MIDKHMPSLALALLALCLLPPARAAAQTLKCDNADQRVGGVDAIDYDKARARLNVNFGKPIKRQDLADAPLSSWVLIDIMEDSDNAVHRMREVVRGDRRNQNADEEFADVFLFPLQPLTPGHRYHLIQSRLTFFGCSPKEALEKSFTVPKDDTTAAGGPQPAAGSPTQPERKTTSFFPKSPSNGREDSNVYLSGLIEGAKGSKTQFSSDVKLDLPLMSTGFFDEIGPLFNFKLGTSDEADANSLSFAAKLRHSHNISRKADPTTHEFVGPDTRILTGLVFDLLPGFESDRRFKNVNTLLGTRLYLVPRVQGGTHRLYFEPFVGYEIGRNIKSPVKDAEGRGLSRPLAGGSLYVYLFPKQISGASLQIDYVRRFLLRREIGFTEDDGKLIPVAVGRGPRDYVKATFGFDLSDFAGVSLSYEYGRLPPNFNLVNSKFSLGLVYKFSSKFPAK